MARAPGPIPPAPARAADLRQAQPVGHGAFFPRHGVLASRQNDGAASDQAGRRNTSKRPWEERVEGFRLSVRAGLACAALCAASALSGLAYGETPDISGTYWATEYRAKIQLVGGGELPLTPAGKEAYEKNVAGLKDGSIVDTARKFCVPDGLPRVLATPYPFEIFQAPPGQVTIIHELNHQVRVIAMDKPLPSEEELT